MNKSRAGIWVGISSALGVMLVAFVNIEREAPGPISAVHGAVESLQGGSSCSACHGGWFGNMTKACSECHADVAAQLADGHGLHGSLDGALAANCSSCHGEHHGSGFRLVNRLAFAQAGVEDEQQFDHAIVGFEMAGAHLELSCSECHENADVAVLSEGQKRYLGLSRDCASCHEDPHGGAMQLDCTTCHGQDTFATRAVATHGRFLELGGPHAEVACRQCHAGGAHALEAMTPKDHRAARSCGDCHDSPHAAAFVAGNAQAAGMPAAAACVTCHPLALPEFGHPAVTVDAAQHGHSGFALGPPHAELACAECHDPHLSYADRHPGRVAHDCRACHADPHGGQFDAGPFAEQGCVGCHATTHFEPHEFDLDRHAQSAFALTGAHVELDCARCHEEPAGDEPRRFDGTPHRCESCHGDAHAGAFAASSRELAAHPRGTCATCHGTDAFADVDLAAFHHERHAGFRIDGAHAQIECTDCHARAEVADHLGRRFGRIVDPDATFGGCVTCHDDPHAGRFDRAEVPAEVDGRSGCARCHGTASFRALPYGFEHGGFTGFPLSGRHAELDCVECHPLRAAPDATGRESHRAKGRECGDCHADPHQRQFERLGRTDCARCHKSQTSFRQLSFRHNLDSRFPLGDAHRKVPCSSCHELESFGAVQAVRYKPLPTDCVDCHGTDRPGRGR